MGFAALDVWGHLAELMDGARRHWQRRVRHGKGEGKKSRKEACFLSQEQRRELYPGAENKIVREAVPGEVRQQRKTKNRTPQEQTWPVPVPSNLPVCIPLGQLCDCSHRGRRRAGGSQTIGWEIKGTHCKWI